MNTDHEIPENLSQIPRAFAALAGRVNALLKLARALVAIRGTGGVKVTLSGENIVVDGSEIWTEIAASAAAAYYHAFRPNAPDGGNITIRRGYVNSLPATGTGGATWSTGTAYKYWVKVTADAAGVATAAEVERGTGSVPADTDTEGYQILFEVDVDGIPTSQHVRTSLRHQMCGEATHLFGGLG